MGSGTFLKVVRTHRLSNGDLISIGKDLNFIVVIDKPTVPVNTNANPAVMMQNMFNENQEYQEARVVSKVGINAAGG